MESTEDMERSYKELKKMAKEQKKSKKKGKKKAKIEKKLAKKEAKLRKKGVFLEDVTTLEEEEEEKPEEFKAGPWVRKSTEDIPYLEKKIDRLAERKETSSLHTMFEEKFGESLSVPETYKEYELSEAEKRRLERIKAIEVESQPVEVVAEGEAEGAEAAAEVEAAEAEEDEATEGEMKPFYHPKQLWLFSKYGKERGKIVKFIILIISVVGWVLLLIPRIIIFILMTIVKKLKRRKAKKVASKA
ncbi:MAG: hypothetical protein JSW00_17035 [Thermoplasmata archaeon]|nr:MAG: hypothetical protein JSW00_17035 [Thermoplasmata archaeon]